ncbi:hypothetical protein J2S43_006484 [Catenuloplanes nepalensis]|uniref:Phospholipase A2 n=1 Tax=Catenuloplanes nepalensis TaxID=587533 RepID=A0ABT9N2R2_9ACTN|nr:phospholipase [Catenuloplanes nepalensis]MDP9797972.1 hypothetical protein [Catenuloplanes nepalensis]
MPLLLSADPIPTVKRLGAVLVALLAVLAIASPAAAAVTPAQKAATLASFTQTGVTSYNAWNAARQNQGAWAEYGFDWSTDYCSSSPDNPLGFDFALSCHRHDFGYRNHKAAGTFPANKSRIDSAFYEDLKRKCATYPSATRPACSSLAWVYYQAVAVFGSVSAVRQSDLDAAARLKEQGLKAEANAA